MQLVAKVVQGLSSAIAEVQSLLRAGLAHRVAVASCRLAYLDGLGVNDENFLTSVQVLSYSLANLLTQRCRVLAAVIVLTAGYQIRHLLAVIHKLAKQIALAVIAHCFFGQTEGNDLKIAEPGDNATPWHIALIIHLIFGELFAYPKNSHEICVQVVHTVI